MHFGHIFAIRFADCQHRLTRSELTANIKNMQISAEICKRQTKIKNVDTKTLIDNLQLAECRQLHQTPIFKYGGGGARAAWRIRIKHKAAHLQPARTQAAGSNANKKQIAKTSIDNLQAAECKQLHQTPIFKYGGGGARAARRIRISFTG